MRENGQNLCRVFEGLCGIPRGWKLGYIVQRAEPVLKKSLQRVRSPCEKANRAQATSIALLVFHPRTTVLNGPSAPHAYAQHAVNNSLHRGQCRTQVWLAELRGHRSCSPRRRHALSDQPLRRGTSGFPIKLECPFNDTSASKHLQEHHAQAPNIGGRRPVLAAPEHLRGHEGQHAAGALIGLLVTLTHGQTKVHQLEDQVAAHLPMHEEVCRLDVTVRHLQAGVQKCHNIHSLLYDRDGFD
mmetsp:Transcript_15335/g.33670  ORF Transcript_15335/g.33670 Transcript_15335/m.33670 type:complete len:242 (+) Transcript_15335:189-914(+)